MVIGQTPLEMRTKKRSRLEEFDKVRAALRALVMELLEDAPENTCGCDHRGKCVMCQAQRALRETEGL